MKIKFLFTMILIGFIAMCIINNKLYAQNEVVIEVMNPEYLKPVNESDNVEIGGQASIDDILKKLRYYYASRNFDEAITLCEAVLKATDDKNVIAIINYTLSANYLEKGIKAHTVDKDDTFYKLSIQYAKKSLEVYPDNWRALGNIGSVYFNMKDYKQAIYYFSEAKKYLTETNPSYLALEHQIIIAEEMNKRHNENK